MACEISSAAVAATTWSLQRMGIHVGHCLHAFLQTLCERRLLLHETGNSSWNRKKPL